MGLLLIFASGKRDSSSLDGEAHPRTTRIEEVPDRFRDLAVACLVDGEADPAPDRIEGDELEAIVTILARLLHTYTDASFDSYVALRSRDLRFAEQLRREDLEQVRDLYLQAGGEADVESASWIGTLEAFWCAYYQDPPAQRFLPGDTRFRILSSPALDADAWSSGFEAFCRREPGFTTWHRLMVPHRRTIAEVASEARGLRWFDVDLTFEGADHRRTRLVTRFVHDPRTPEWFLERAATVHEDGLADDSLRLVL